MKKIILSISLLILIATSVQAQSGNNISLSLGPELNFPFNAGTNDYGSTRNYYQNGLGGTLKTELPVSSSVHITVSIGYIHYFTNQYYVIVPAYYPGYVSNDDLKAPPFLFMPVKTGLQYYYSKYMYLSAEAGEAFKLNSVSKNSFIYSGGLGGVIPFNAKSGLDIGVRYERGYKIMEYQYAMSQIGLRIAYKHSF